MRRLWRATPLLVPAAVRDYERMEAYNKTDWCMTIVEATLFVDGAKVTRSCIGGVESDAGEEAFQEIVDSLITDVLASPHAVSAESWERASARIITHQLWHYLAIR